jgi:hypothetical protein
MAGLSLGRIVAGGLEGLGAAGVEQARMKEATRFQAMLENLRSSNQREETTVQYDLADRNTARQTDRQTDKELIVNRQQADLTKDRDEAQHQRNIEIIGIEGDQAQALDRFRSGLRKQEAAYGADLEKGAKAGEFDILEGGDGFYYKVFGSGKMERTLVQVPERQLTHSGSGSTSTLDALRQGSAPARGVAQAAPTTQVERPESQTYSQAEAAATAKKHGVSVDEVHRRMRAAGYKLTGG